MMLPMVLIVSPGLAADNNGNWQTARRWSHMLRGHARTRILSHWPAPGESTDAVAMLALHARRSADSIEAWASAHPGQGLAVVLTLPASIRSWNRGASSPVSVKSRALSTRTPSGGGG